MESVLVLVGVGLLAGAIWKTRKKWRFLAAKPSGRLQRSWLDE